MAERYIIIRHEDGREYAVLPASFHAIYEPQGFVAAHYEDGDREEYTAPTPAAPAKGSRAKATEGEANAG